MDKTQRRYTDEEVNIIKSLFKGNDKALKILRKTFLPTYDYEAPLGQVVDLWMTLKLDDQTPQQREVNILARNQVITHIEQQLIQLQFLANEVEETAEQKALREKKNSTK